jgi:hypothetical protein
MTKRVLNTVIKSPETQAGWRFLRSSKKARPGFRGCPLPLGEGGAQRRVRAARPTILQIDEIVGRAALIRRLRATFSRWEKDRPFVFRII